MKTIKQIADELGVSKQKVYRFIVRNHITASSEVSVKDSVNIYLHKGLHDKIM